MKTTRIILAALFILAFGCTTSPIIEAFVSRPQVLLLWSHNNNRRSPKPSELFLRYTPSTTTITKNEPNAASVRVDDTAKKNPHKRQIREETSPTPTLDTSQQQQPLQWLAYILLEYGFAPDEIRFIADQVYQSPNPPGAAQFLRLLLYIDPDQNLLVSTPVILAALEHFEDIIIMSQNREQPQPQQHSDEDKLVPTVFVPVRSITESYETGMIREGASKLMNAESLISNYGINDNRIQNFLLSVTDDWRSLAIRIVAQLYELTTTTTVNNGLCTKERSINVQQAKRALHVYAPLAQRLGLRYLQSSIEDTVFQYLYPRQYRAVKQLYDKQSLEQLCNLLLRDISDLLHEDQVVMENINDLQITARVKEPFSLWKKLLRKQREGDIWENVQDGVALRIILDAKTKTEDDSIAALRQIEYFLCYYVDQLIRSRWPVFEGRRKDYISNPKPNGYQSLHFTSSVPFRGRVLPFEVQVRSSEMHRAAEYGYAAHWDYKKLHGNDRKTLLPGGDTRGSVLALPPSNPISNDTVDRMSQSYLDALIEAKDNIIEHHVYAFVLNGTSSEGHGRLLSLPPGSAVADIMGNMMTDQRIGNGERIMLNGKIAAPGDKIKNGDVIMINL